MGRYQQFDIVVVYLHTILENSIKQQSLAISFGVWPLKVNVDRVHASDLLISVRIAVANGNSQYQKFWVILRDFGEDLNEIESPVATRMLFSVC